MDDTSFKVQSFYKLKINIKEGIILDLLSDYYLHLISLFDLCINNGPAVGCVEGSPSKSVGLKIQTH